MFKKWESSLKLKLNHNQSQQSIFTRLKKTSLTYNNIEAWRTQYKPIHPLMLLLLSIENDYKYYSYVWIK